METVGAFEAKTHLSELLQKVEAGREFTITRHGKPVAKLTPITHDDKASRARCGAAVDALMSMPRARLAKGETIKQLIEEGRRF